MIDPTQEKEMYQALEEEAKTSSDRALTIVTASFLDILLEQAIIEAFVPGDKSAADQQLVKQLFSGNGALSSFSSRISICYRFGLISDQGHKLLHIVRNIRNEFAHSPKPLYFNTSPIKDHLLNMDIPSKHLIPENIPIPDRNGKMPPFNPPSATDQSRDYFLAASAFLIRALFARQCKAYIEGCASPPDFDRPSDPLRTTREVYEIQVAQIQTVRDAIEEHIKFAEPEMVNKIQTTIKEALEERFEKPIEEIKKEEIETREFISGMALFDDILDRWADPKENHDS